MKNKIIITLTLISMVVAGSVSVSVQASGSHTHDNEGGVGDEESAVGKPAAEADSTKTIQVVTKDSMRYEFSPVPDIKAGDIVTFIVTNEGQIPHEFSIGDKREQDAHRKMMQKMPNMVHEDGNTTTVKPGETKKLTWNFSGTVKGLSEVVFACNVPGHFEAGMFHKMTIGQQSVMTQQENVKQGKTKHHDMGSHHHQ